MKKYLFILTLVSLVSCKDNSRDQESTGQPDQSQEQNQGQIREQQQNETSDVSDLIQVIEPRPEETLSSPVRIKGKARGTWFFEGDFPIYLLDENNEEIAVAIATAQGEWMTEEWVEFSATLEYENPTSERGILRFVKNNPSDQRDLDRSLEISVNFK